MTISHGDVIAIFLALGVLLATARLLGEIAQRLGQPAVVGEIVAGILLGPTLLGAVWPHLQRSLFPASGNVPIVIDGFKSVAIALFLLVAGMEVDLSTILRLGKTSIFVAMAGFIVPFILGAGAALLAPHALGCEEGESATLFAIFLGVALSISALPVIAKTLMDLNLYRSELGMIVIASAVVNDLAGWLVFAMILAAMGVQTGPGGVVGTIAATLLFAGFMLTGGRWLINRLLPWLQAYTTWPGGVLGFSVALALFAAAFTEWIGIHAVFGAFLVGIAIGDSRHLREQTRRAILDFVSFIFAPLFFASIGLRLDYAEHFDLGIVAAVLAIACLGKVLGCGLAAFAMGVDRRTSGAIGFAMNARGAMEIILGMLALQNGLINEQMFVALVVMALVTSMISGPAIAKLLRLRKPARFIDYLAPQGFAPELSAQDRFEAIRELMPLLSTGHKFDAQKAIEAVIAREEAGGSGLEHQIAVPHARLAGLSKPLVAVGVSAAGIDFDSADGQPAHIVCLVLSPADHSDEHLALMADVARTFQREAARNQAMRARSLTELRSAVRT
jgi:Kef-type K+ transport system membrane component KefB/mannitol/fructose-specific phosphotransferase system IIA component